MTAGILRYSRDLAFAAATAYADQAEARGAWDTRMEAKPRRRRGPRGHRTRAAIQAAALELGGYLAGHRRSGPAADRAASIWPARTSMTSPSRNGRAALSDVHGTWLVAIVSGALTPPTGS